MTESLFPQKILGQERKKKRPGSETEGIVIYSETILHFKVCYFMFCSTLVFEMFSQILTL